MAGKITSCTTTGLNIPVRFGFRYHETCTSVLLLTLFSRKLFSIFYTEKKDILLCKEEYYINLRRFYNLDLNEFVLMKVLLFFLLKKFKRFMYKNHLYETYNILAYI